MKILTGSLIVVLAMAALPLTVNAQAPPTIAVTRTDSSTIDGYVFASSWCGRHRFGKLGGIDLLDQHSDLERNLPFENTYFDGFVVTMANATGASASGDVGGSVVVIPPPGVPINSSEITMSSSHQGAASAVHPACTGLGLTCTMDQHTYHKVANFGSDNHFTLESHLYLFAGSATTQPLDRCLLRATVGSCEVEAEYMGNDIFFLDGWLRHDEEVGNGGIAGELAEVMMVKSGGVNEHFIGTQLVANNQVFGIRNVMDTRTSLTFNIDNQPPGSSGINWLFVTLANGTVRDLQ